MTHHRPVEGLGPFVIALNSSFTYKGLSVKCKRSAANCGVRFVTGGQHPQGRANRVRITAQLVDAP